MEGAQSAQAMGKEEDLGTILACSTQAVLKKVCLLWQIIAYSIYGRIACVQIIDPNVWIIDPTEFGSLIQKFGSLIQVFESLTIFI